MKRKILIHENPKIEPDYKYKAKLGRVVDGDTIDVIMHLGFYVELKERLRLEGVNTPEIFRVKKDSEEYKLGMKAKRYIKRRLKENGKIFGARYDGCNKLDVVNYEMNKDEYCFQMKDLGLI